jgi:hypothetical protein
MSVAVYHAPTKMSPAQYDEVIRHLEAAGHGNPPGRILHTAFGGDPAIQVFDVWDSPESLAAFGEVLMPILHQVGVEAGPPMVMPMYKMAK